MKINLLLVLFCLTFISCNKSNDDKKPVVTTDFAVMDDPGHSVEDPLPALAFTMDANIEFFNFSREQQEKMEAAIEIIKLVVATEEFRSRVLNHTYNGKKTFVDNGGLTNSQIYQVILDGAERLQPSKNNSIDAEVELYYQDTNTIGYTYASSKRIWVNTKYFDSYTAAGVAHNLFHEWMHKLGFSHSVSWSLSRDYSVPYALGRVVGELGKNFL